MAPVQSIRTSKQRLFKSGQVKLKQTAESQKNVKHDKQYCRRFSTRKTCARKASESPKRFVIFPTFLFDSPYRLSSRTVLIRTQGDKMIVKHMFPRARFEPGHSKGSLWHNFLRPKKTVVWSPEVLEKAPSGEKVVERYIENFDPEAFNKYITNEEKKTKQVLLSTLKKLTKADEKTNPSEFAQIIHELEPILNVKSLRLLPEESISNFFQPAFTITSDLTKSINSIIFETLKEHLNRHKSFLEPEENLWMFYRSLKDRLNESERGKGEFRYDSLSLEKVTKEMFKEAKSLKMINDDVLQKMSEGYTLSILLARLNFSKEDQNLTEEKALQIRQCLGSLYAFLLRYNKSIKSDPLPNSINEYLSKIYHRYSDSPELRHFANQLHQEYNSIFPESKRHDITKISLDDQSINE
ncbi:hypothetical protein DFH28DRAFT_1129987 [Melampsora americana]|nr:hypothetical protein DFH28DRAFT_1129987 [Melampsora americana]